MQANETAGFAVPRSFTVRDKTWIKVMLRVLGVVCTLSFLVLLAGVPGSSFDEPEKLVGG